MATPSSRYELGSVWESYFTARASSLELRSVISRQRVGPLLQVSWGPLGSACWEPETAPGRGPVINDQTVVCLRSCFLTHYLIITRERVLIVFSNINSIRLTELTPINVF